MNPDPEPNSCKRFSICHWNINSITSHNFIKVSLLLAYKSIHKIDIICLSETYLNSETLSNEENLNVTSYNLIRVDHLSNTKCGGVFIYFKESQPLRLYNVSYLDECICFEIMISNIFCNFILLYRTYPIKRWFWIFCLQLRFNAWSSYTEQSPSNCHHWEL